MSITLKDMKNYLRVDGSQDDTLIRSLISSSEGLCMDVLRTDDTKTLYGSKYGKAAVMYAVDGNGNLKRAHTDLRTQVGKESYLFG